VATIEYFSKSYLRYCTQQKNGLEIVIKQIEKKNLKFTYVVLGVVNDKDLNEILPLFPKHIIFCKPIFVDSKLSTSKSFIRPKGEVYNLFQKLITATKSASKSDFITLAAPCSCRNFIIFLFLLANLEK
jgi:hypothetical protein